MRSQDKMSFLSSNGTQTGQQQREISPFPIPHPDPGRPCRCHELLGDRGLGVRRAALRAVVDMLTHAPAAFPLALNFIASGE